jgi:hypothetical protein
VPRGYGHGSFLPLILKVWAPLDGADVWRAGRSHGDWVSSDRREALVVSLEGHTIIRCYLHAVEILALD